MRLFKRRAADPAIEALRAAFRVCAGRVGAAQNALLSAIPTSRDPGIGLPRALGEFFEHLEAAGLLMRDWRDDRVVHEWTNCERAITEARERASRLREIDERGTEIGFEALNARAGEVLDPLEAFAEAAVSLRRL